MFPYFLILGILILITIVLILKWFTSADPKRVLKVFKWFFIIFGSIFGLFFILSGRLSWVFIGIPVLFPILMRVLAVMRLYKVFSRFNGSSRNNFSPRTSHVRTETLDMTLDQETGEMKGQIKKGPFKGSAVENLSEDDTLMLLKYCLENDREAAQVIEAYLNRIDPDWHSKFENRNQNVSSTIDREQAFKVLGLNSDSTDQEIKTAYHKLIRNLHPDRGGSAYLAAKINEAKDILLGK